MIGTDWRVDETRRLRELVREYQASAEYWQQRCERVELDTRPLLAERSWLIQQERERGEVRK